MAGSHTEIKSIEDCKREALGPNLEEERIKTEISEKPKRRIPECCTGK